MLAVAMCFLTALSPRDHSEARVSSTDVARCWALRRPRWHEQESWTWGQLCRGQVADLDVFATGPAGRTLRATFLVMLSADPTFRDALPFGQVFIKHANFDETIDLSDASLARGLRLDDCTFGADVIMARTSTNAPISLNRAIIDGSLTLADLHGTSLYLMGVSIKGGIDAHDLVLSGNMRAILTEPQDLTLTRARVGGYIDIEGSIRSIVTRNAQSESLQVTNAQVSGSLNAANSHFGHVSISDTTLGGSAYFEDAVIDQSMRVERSNLRSATKSAGTQKNFYATDPCYGDTRALDGDNATIGNVLLAEANIGGFSLNRSTINQDVVIHTSTIAFACMRDTLVHGVLEVANARVGHRFDVRSASIERNAYFSHDHIPSLDANEAIFGGSCSLNDIDSPTVTLIRARIAHGFSIVNLSGNGYINASDANVGGNLTIAKSQSLRDLTLRGITVGDSFDVSNLVLDSADISDARFQSSARLADLRVNGNFEMSATSVEGDLHLTDIEAPLLDLSGARVARTLFFTRDHTKPLQTLSLRDAVVQTVEDRAKANCDEFGPVIGRDCLNPWPEKMQLEGFHFSQLGSLSANSKKDLLDRKVDWWKDWLAHQSRYVPETYDTLATVMQGAGYDQNAKAIAEERRDQDRLNSSMPGSGLMLLWRFADGYGYVIYYAALWAMFFMVLGALVLRFSGEGNRLHMPIGLTYSFDMLVPLIFLEKAHEEIRLRGWARYYFYFHKIVGYVLATFLVAGLSVLAK